jgi:DNA-binding response OmpR family regulator
MPSSIAPILVVDDDAVTRHILFDYLSRAGYQPVTASSGEEALERLKTLTPALVLLDLVLPDADGYEVLRAIRADDRVRDVPVVVLTALEGDEEIARAFEEGADDFLHKPFRNAELVARIRGQLRLRGYLVELAQKERDAAGARRAHAGPRARRTDIREILHTVVRRIAETWRRRSLLDHRRARRLRARVCRREQRRPGRARPAHRARALPRDPAGAHLAPPLLIDDAPTHPLLDAVRELVSGTRFPYLALFPIALEHRAFGVLFLRASEARGRLDEREQALCETAPTPPRRRCATRARSSSCGRSASR